MGPSACRAQGAGRGQCSHRRACVRGPRGSRLPWCHASGAGVGPRRSLGPSLLVTPGSVRARRSPTARSRAQTDMAPRWSLVYACWGHAQPVSPRTAARSCGMRERRAGPARAQTRAPLARLTAEIFQSKVLEDYKLNFRHSCVPVDTSWWASRGTSSAESGRCNAVARRKRLSTETFR